jgi:protein-tyrosine phosphatase
MSEDGAGPIDYSYWVEPGRLLAGRYPAISLEDSPTEDLQRLLDEGIDCFVDLTVEGEKGLRAYKPFLDAAGVGYMRFAIEDWGCPSVEEMDAILDAVDDALERGRRVYVHCYGGVGRTGTVVGCYLIRRGAAGGDALTRLRALRGGYEAPETESQREFVRAWSQHVSR